MFTAAKVIISYFISFLVRKRWQHWGSREYLCCGVQRTPDEYPQQPRVRILETVSHWWGKWCLCRGKVGTILSPQLPVSQNIKYGRLITYWYNLQKPNNLGCDSKEDLKGCQRAVHLKIWLDSFITEGFCCCK